MLKIRCSTLPSYNDCPRRAAANSWRKLIEERGFVLRKTPPGIGASIGTAVHAAQKHALTLKKNTGDAGNIDDGIEIGINEFKTAVVDGVEYDGTTGSKNDGEKQIITLTKSLYLEVVPNIEPKLIEHPRPAKITPELELTGTLDVETILGDIGDTKTGSQIRPYQAQFGGYSLLKKSHDSKSATSCFVDHLQRTSVKKTYPGAKRYFYDVATCERMAMIIIAGISRDLSKFVETGKPWSFAANPMSSICSPKYCSAYGTDFCEYHKE